MANSDGEHVLELSTMLVWRSLERVARYALEADSARLP